MRIGFDAKRAFQNNTGLGHYSRTLLSSLATYFPQHEYFLFAPKITNRFCTDDFSNMHPVSPQKFPEKIFPSLWRSNWVTKDLLKNKIALYHGLSHEIPVGITSTGIRSVVTIHDLIFERYPRQHHKIDVLIYRKKFRYACIHADKVIAVSLQTKQDLMNFYHVPEEKISVCYQSCNPRFGQTISDTEKERIRELYKLPRQFFLSVGSIIERKNLLIVCKAIQRLKNRIAIPLVVIGQGGKYKHAVQQFIREHKLEKEIIFLSDSAVAKASEGFNNSADFPAIYQLATAMIYPSVFEGFGIPVLEALWSRLPVITSNVSCMPETGGDAALYVSPYDYEDLADKMETIATDSTVAQQMKEKGWSHAQQFTQQKCAVAVMDVYNQLLL